MTSVSGSDAVTQIQGGYPDQQVRERKAEAAGLVLTVDLSSANSNRNSDRVDREGDEEFLDKLIPLGSSLWRIRAGGTMRQLNKRDYGGGDLGVSQGY